MVKPDRERAAFIDALAANEDDTATRLVYADWLEERGDDDEAARQRAWPAAKAWLKDWVRSINYREYDDDAEGDPIPTGRREENSPHTYADAIEAGHAALSGEGYCWATDAGADFFLLWNKPEEGDANRAEWFRNWSIVTGVPVPDAVVEQPPFRCAC